MDPFLEKITEYGLALRTITNQTTFTENTPKIITKFSYSSNLRIFCNINAQLFIQNPALFESRCALPDYLKKYQSFYFYFVILRINEMDKSFDFALIPNASSKKNIIQQHIVDNYDTYENYLRKFKLQSLFNNTDPTAELADKILYELCNTQLNKDSTDSLSTLYAEILNSYMETFPIHHRTFHSIPPKRP